MVVRNTLLFIEFNILHKSYLRQKTISDIENII